MLTKLSETLKKYAKGWIVLVFFALDEIRHYHEKLGDWLLVEVGSAGSFRNWNDPLVLAYGAVAVLIALAFLPEVLRYKRFTGLFAAGFLFGHARGMDPETCAKLGALAAAEVISHIGARPQVSLKDLAAQHGFSV